MVQLGQRLRSERLQKKQTLEEVAAAIKIKPQFLAAIEKGEYAKLPSPTYARGFVKNYATYLGLSKSETAALFRREFDESRIYKVLPDSLTKKKELPRLTVRWRQQFLLVPFIFLLIIGYLFFQYRAFFFPPALIIYLPKPDSRVGQTTVVSGKADTSAFVFVDNQQVSLGPDGTFSTSLNLFPGKTTVTVVARNTFGKQTIIQRGVTVK